MIAVLLAISLMVEPGPGSSTHDVFRQMQAQRPNPLLMDNARPLPSQEILPGRQIFSADGAPLGVVDHALAVTGGQMIYVTLPNGTVKAVRTHRWIVSDGGVVIGLTMEEFRASANRPPDARP